MECRCREIISGDGTHGESNITVYAETHFPISPHSWQFCTARPTNKRHVCMLAGGESVCCDLRANMIYSKLNRAKCKCMWSAAVNPWAAYVTSTLQTKHNRKILFCWITAMTFACALCLAKRKKVQQIGRKAAAAPTVAERYKIDNGMMCSQWQQPTFN